MTKPVEVVLRFRMDERTAKLFLQSSIERVINTSMNIVESVADGHEHQDINYEDWVEWKPVVVGMWTAMNSALFGVFNNIPVDETRYIDLRKGDL